MNTGSVSMLIVDKTIVIVARKWRSKWWKIQCVGCKSKRRKDGSCKHERQTLERASPDIRDRCRITPLSTTPEPSNPQ